MKITKLISYSVLVVVIAAYAAFSTEEYGMEDGYYAEDGYYEEYGNDGYAAENYNNEQGSAYQEQNSYQAQPVANRTSRSNGGGRVVEHAIKDPKTGMVSCTLPLPSNWKVGSNGISSPNGSVVRDQKGAMYTEQMRRVNSIDQIIQQDVIPNIRQNGGQVLGSFDLPEVSRRDQQNYAMYWQAMPAQNIHQAKAIEAKDAQGNPNLIVIHFTLTRSQYGNMAFYYGNVMTSNAAAYEQDKKALLYGLANMKLNPQQVAVHNRNEQQKSQASWSAHNQKMRANQANFDAWNKTHQETYNAINKASMDSYWARSNSSDRMHDKVVDGIWERQNAIDPYNGQQVKVDAGYNNYYMNNYNEYIGTDDEFYKPNMDPNVNNTEWRAVEDGGY